MPCMCVREHVAIGDDACNSCMDVNRAWRSSARDARALGGCQPFVSVDGRVCGHGMMYMTMLGKCHRPCFASNNK